VKVRVPASIANLGPGFDVLAMAVDLWLEVDAEPASQPEWRFEGEDPGPINPFSALAMRGVVRSEIPVGVGLGSSAAARLAALALRGVEAPIGQAVREEGHPDNAWAAFSGGMRLVVDDAHFALPVPDLEVALFVASEPAPTAQARAALPKDVSRVDAVFNVARAALLVHTLYERRWEWLRPALEDRLHQPQRLHLYPYVADVIHAAHRSGWGAAVSGAGPSVFALCSPGEGAALAEAMTAAAPEHGRPLVTRVSRRGMEVAR
jgi:homoserine kinase